MRKCSRICLNNVTRILGKKVAHSYKIEFGKSENVLLVFLEMSWDVLRMR